MTQLLTRTEELKIKLDDCIRENRYCRVYMRNRQPIYGKFVVMEDFNELKSKQMYRFVLQGREVMFNAAQFRNAKEALTRLLLFTEIEEIQKY